MTTATPTCERKREAALSEPVILADAYREGMRSLAAGVCLITSTHEGEHGGMVATAVSSVSAEPPTLLVCVNRSASLFETIKSSGLFCVNVLDHQAVSLVEIFSSSARRSERFKTGEWSLSSSGVRISDTALVVFECQVAQAIDWHSHVIFLGEVIGVSRPKKNRSEMSQSPLLYMDRQFRQLAGV